MSDVDNMNTTVAEKETVNVDASRRNFFKNSIAGAFGAAAMMNLVPDGIRSAAWAAGWARMSAATSRKDRRP